MEKVKFLFLFFSLQLFSQDVSIEFFSGSFTSPVEITHPLNDSRLFVVQQNGIIKIVNPDGTIKQTPFLDISSKVSNDIEGGLLGLAFHQNYDVNGNFYVYYLNNIGDSVIAKYSVSENPDIANPAESLIMLIDQPFPEHNCGTLRFGRDGYLYIGLGDGGSAGDPYGYSQNTEIDNNFPSRVFLGKILRIDINSDNNYSIPSSNPLIGQAGKEEIWAKGFRNPWKFSFNRLNGEIWIPDVGQETTEEINKLPYPFSNELLNYGWNCLEGTNSYNTVNCQEMASIQMPIAEYSHTDNSCSVTGGYFYTGTLYPNFQNKYFFADFCKAKIGMINENGEISWSNLLPVNYITTFGEDINGELYIANLQDNNIYKVIDNTLKTFNNQIKKISVYPNPAKNLLTIENIDNSEFYSVKIFDITGKLLYSENNLFESSLTINISNFSSGLYLITSEDLFGNQMKSKVIID